MPVSVEIVCHEIEQLQETFARIEMLDVDLKLAVPQPAERFLKHCDVKLRFAAEVMIDHARIAARLLDDAAYARPGKAVSDEFTRRGAQYLFAAFRGFTARPP